MRTPSLLAYGMFALPVRSTHTDLTAIICRSTRLLQHLPLPSGIRGKILVVDEHDVRYRRVVVPVVPAIVLIKPKAASATMAAPTTLAITPIVTCWLLGPLLVTTGGVS